MYGPVPWRASREAQPNTIVVHVTPCSQLFPGSQGAICQISVHFYANKSRSSPCASSLCTFHIAPKDQQVERHQFSATILLIQVGLKPKPLKLTIHRCVLSELDQNQRPSRVVAMALPLMAAALLFHEQVALQNV